MTEALLKAHLRTNSSAVIALNISVLVVMTSRLCEKITYRISLRTVL
jgi:hypothetical protein